MQYFFILGRIPELSTAELLKFALFHEGKSFKAEPDTVRYLAEPRSELCSTTGVKEVSEKFIILETDKKIDLSFWQKQLGGIVKCGEVIKETQEFLEEEVNPVKSSEGGILSKTKLFNRVKEILLNKIKNEKIFFGLSLYSLTRKVPFNEIKDYSTSLKKAFKKQGFSASFVLPKEKPFLSTATIIKNKLLEKGMELVFLIEKDKILIGQTQAIQSIEEEAALDFLRPHHEITEGLIPPKLAKILINLASVRKEEIILDPFCGSGTILGQAFLMGYQYLIGSDKSQKAISQTKENMAWLKEKFGREAKPDAIRYLAKPGAVQYLAEIKIFQSDVKEISRKLPPHSISAIITEPFLGPLQIQNQPQRIIEDLSLMYLQAFESFKKVLKPGGKVVIIFPILKMERKEYFLPILEKISSLGWKKEELISGTCPVPLSGTGGRGSLVYSRPEQKVLREIFVFSN